MSKITPKNLQYDSSLPPFLARLQANNGSRDGRQDFHAARPKKLRSAQEEAEDEPVYFDEGTGETLTKTEWEEREAEVDARGGLRGEDGQESGGAGEGEEREKRERETKEKIAAIGGTKKRKAGKIIGGDEEEVKAAKEGASVREPSKADGKKAEEGKASKKGKKGKVKLSFGDDE